MTVASTRASSPSPSPAAGGARLAPPRRRRSLPLVAVGVLCSFGGALLFALAYLGAGHHQAVLEVIQPVPAGGVITEADLQVTSLSAAPGLQVVPAAERPSVVGKVATVSLVPGSLLAPAQFGSGPALGLGQAVVGVGLKPGAMPGSLLPGEQVMIVDTAAGTPGTISPPGGSVLVPQATVFAVPPAGNAANADPSQTPVVSVVVPAVEASTVAAAAAASQVSLVLVGGAP